ncbi:BtrH N-terminal domain-containing protein [Streptomyces sp. NPDC001903]|uniref:BtrH N-terminal domain-containing protein n=1 Tax=Streptomyces sp. NPDC001903 TaxID=3364622 RepID=UPI0036810DBB
MRVELGPVGYWRHELSHCLHTTAGVLLGFHGLDPVQALGAGWGFDYPAGDIRREEYYFPGAAEDLFGGLAPFHDVHSRWHEPADAREGWEQVRAALAAGTPVAVAADNFHLPFRPAYRDVHTNHLMVLYGFDDTTGDVFVADPVPPAFQGTIPLAALEAARDSGNPVHHDRDLFFTANPIGNRWLELRIGEDQPAFDPEFVDRVTAANLRALRAEPSAADTAAGHLRGLAGLRTFLTEAFDRLPGDPAVGDEVFVVIGPVLAVTGLHAEFLREAGRRFGELRLAELAREVDRVAHHWSALRIAVATAGPDRAAQVPGLLRRTAALLDAYDRALDGLQSRLDARGQALRGA